MAKKLFIWKLYISYILVIVATLGTATWYFSIHFRRFHLEQTTEKLTTYAKLYAPQIAPLIEDSNNAQIDILCKTFGQLSSARITVIRPDGTVIGDSDQPPDTMENHFNRSEIVEAIKKGFGKSSRFSSTDRKNMTYVAVPIEYDGKTIAIIRTAVSIEEIEKSLHNIYIRIAAVGIIISLTAAVLNIVIIIFNDSARFRKLENIRKDFVANVSHELKTPITSIKGFAETLLEGDLTNQAQTRQFLDVIAKNTQRLDAIIDDLLSLSRLEDGQSKRDLVFKTVYLKTILANAIELSHIKAQQKQITITLNCLDDLKVNANTLLLEQAVFNLIDNAIKYSEANKTIKVVARESEKELLISVEDNGCGMEHKHLSRIFERFYVVDKSRSRKLGGTGLGLAIIKHIVGLHKGSVNVESLPGTGSTFTIHLPRT
ncbi:MAG: ATP-binding protein [Planctomycetaceae bacterium]|nr:ATP-binding protein [Planctomycetaceae bacterium]